MAKFLEYMVSHSHVLFSSTHLPDYTHICRTDSAHTQLARYLDRGYWEQRREQQASGAVGGGGVAGGTRRAGGVEGRKSPARTADVGPQVINMYPMYILVRSFELPNLPPQDSVLSTRIASKIPYCPGEVNVDWIV